MIEGIGIADVLPVAIGPVGGVVGAVFDFGASATSEGVYVVDAGSGNITVPEALGASGLNVLNVVLGQLGNVAGATGAGYPVDIGLSVLEGVIMSTQAGVTSDESGWSALNPAPNLTIIIQEATQ